MKKLTKILSKMPDLVDIKSNDNGFAIYWSCKNVGFGELFFYKKNNKIYCNNELMNKEFIKIILCRLVDKCILTET